MKRWLFILFLPLSFFANSQTVTMSDEVSIRNDISYGLLGKMGDDYLLFRDKGEEYEIQAYNSKMRAIWKKELVFEKKRVNILEAIPGKDHFHVVYSYNAKGHTLLKAHRYDLGANLIDSVTVFDYGKRYYSPKPTLIYSEDKSKALIYHFEKQTEIEAYCFDFDNMELQWQASFRPKNLSYLQDFVEIVLDDEGQVYVALERDNRRSKKELNRFEIFTFGPNHSKIETMEISMESMLTYDVFFDFDNLNNSLTAAGLYSDKNRGRADGYFFLKVPMDAPTKQELYFQPFTEDFLIELTSQEKTKKIKGLPDIDVQEIVHRNDGGILMIIEQNREKQHGAYSGRQFGGSAEQHIVDYYYNDVVVISIHPTGEEHWKTILRKKQYSQNDGAIFSSYFLAKTPKHLRFLYNDEIRSENLVSEYTISANGTADRNAVLSTDNQSMQLRIPDAMQISSKELLIPSERKYKLKLVKLIFD